MKKIIILFALLLNFTVLAQEGIRGGTPVVGLKTITRESTDTNTSSSAENNSLLGKIEPTNRGPIDPDPIDPIDPIDPTDPTDPGDPHNPNNGNIDLSTLVYSTDVTAGELSVSLTGGATYSIPFTLPPGINNLKPQISLSYNSQSVSGNAGYGWNIAGISMISRTSATKFHDNTIDGVDFDASDRFTLDGQRLMLKTGTIYGADEAEYQTELFSNIKVTSYGVSPFGAEYGPQYFLVQYPDGSKAYYGQNTNSRSRNDWAITYWENSVGARINYEYNNVNNLLSISKIGYGTLGSVPSINEIQFLYITRNRPEQFYVNGISFIDNTIINQIRVIGNGVPYRNYILGFNASSLGYQRLISITEKSGDNSKSLNPTVFTYEDLANDMTTVPTSGVFGTSNTNQFNTAMISGKFSGKGAMDYILYPTVGSNAKKEYWLFTGVNDLNINNIGYVVNEGSFQEIFPVSWLGGNSSLGYKFIQEEGWCIIKPSLTTNNVNFVTYSTGVTNPILFQYDKVHPFPKFILTYLKEPCTTSKNSDNHIGQGQNIIDPIDPEPNDPVYVTVEKIVPKTYLSGDFNGDGLTDVLAIEKTVDYQVTLGCSTYNQTSTGGKAYFVNLDKRISSNYVNFAGYLNTTNQTKYYVSDYNGDGKFDIMVVNSGEAKIYTLNDNNQLILLWTIIDSDITLAVQSPIFSGDFNGDGKMDFVTPKGYGNDFAFFYSTGASSVKSIKILPFSHNELLVGAPTYDTGSYFDYWDIIPSDINNDGSTDLIQSKYRVNEQGNTKLNFDINVKIYVSKNDNFVLELEKDVIPGTSNSSCLPLPIFLNPSVQNNNLELGFIYENKIVSTFYKKNFDNERLLKKISLGNGVKETITYSSLIGNGEFNADGIPFYTSSYPSLIESYPNYDVNILPGIKVVSKIERQSKNLYKKQCFGYYGPVSNVDGLGFLGFRSTLKTNWYNDNYTKISNVTNYDISKRGAVKEMYSFLNMSPTFFIAPTNFISKSIIDYNDEFLPNKVRKISNTSSKIYNGLEGFSKEVVTDYDINNNPVQNITYSKVGSTVQKTDKTNFIYEDDLSGANYVIGRPIQKNIESIYGSSTMTTEEIFSYFPNNLIKQLKKKGTGTNYLTEDYIYDNFGNTIQKKTTAVGLTPRIAYYEYDPSGRFLTKNIGNDLLVSNYTHDTSTGQILTEMNPFGLMTTNAYDVWLRKRKVTDYLGKKKTYLFQMKDVTDVSVLLKDDNGSQSIIVYDDLGREMITGVNNINNFWTYLKVGYDIYDRKISESQPYDNINGSPSQVNLSSFDVYSRLSQSVSYTGKITNITYSGLSSTVNDGYKTTVTTKNSAGNIISFTDNGGTINYQHYANGNLKQSNYNGVSTDIQQDGWGRKSQLTDPSAGGVSNPYKYTYNDFGELLTEITPNGTTTNSYDNYGKLSTKVISGLNTSSYIDYQYNSTNQITLVDHTDINGDSSPTEYFYDTYHRVNDIVESLPVATFEKKFTYDDFGRIEKEFNESIEVSTGKSSNKWFKNVYKNGKHWQILDFNSNQILWQINTVNVNGQLTNATLGNGIEITNTYNSYGYISQSKYDFVSTNAITLNYTFEPQRGNLTNRNSTLFNFSENFQYDTLDRLVEYTNSRGQQVQQDYDNSGRISENNFGKYNYTTNEYQNSSINISPEAKAYYKSREGVFFDTMEKQTGWAIYDPTNITFDTTFSNSANGGNTSLKINNPTTSEKVVNSELWIPIDNNVATSYTYSGWVYSNGPQAEIFLFMKDVNGTISTNQVVSNTTNGWIFLQQTFLVPANIKRLSMRVDNNGLGIIWFDNLKIRKTSIAEITNPADKKLEISYNAFKSPVSIYEPGNDRVSFDYNAINNRSVMYYGGLETDKMQRKFRKYYSSIGGMEIVLNTQTDGVEFVTYIGGDGYAGNAVLKSNGTNEEYLYLHRDYQGTIVAISNNSGNIIEKRAFDAWGNVLKIQDAQGNLLSSFVVLDRGYTGHEHLQGVNLVHMNARLYDPFLHRFLQPDNYIQDPYNTQNFNRYAYVLNNPLKYNDLSGEMSMRSFLKIVAFATAVVVAAVLSGGILLAVAAAAESLTFLGAVAVFAVSVYIAVRIVTWLDTNVNGFIDDIAPYDPENLKSQTEIIKLDMQKTNENVFLKLTNKISIQ